MGESILKDGWALDWRVEPMSSYWYDFERTGVEAIDRILAEIAWSGKAFHSTEFWNNKEEGWMSYIERIQAAADSAAIDITAIEREVKGEDGPD